MHPVDALRQLDDPEERWRVITSYFEMYGHVRYQMEGFEKFMRELVPHIIVESSTIRIDSKPRRVSHVIEFGRVTIFKPSMREADGTVHTISPHEARTRRQTYSNNVCVDMTHTVTQYGGSADDEFADSEVVSCTRHEKREVPLFEIPCMVRSRYCHLHDVGRLHDQGGNECPEDQGGYFVINGNEKVLIGQLKLRVNKPYVWETANSTKYGFMSEVRSCHETKWRSTSTLKMHITRSTPPDIHVNLPFVMRGSMALEVPLVGLFKLLGLRTRESILRVLIPTDPAAGVETAKVCETLTSCVFDSPMMQMSPKEVLEWVGQEGTREKTEDKRRRYIEHILLNETLPHLGMTNAESVRAKKAYYLGMIARRLVSVHLGVELPDDRDHNANKRVDGPGPLLAILFRQLFRNHLKSFRVNVQKFVEAGKFVNVVDHINAKKITSGLRYHFNTGNWSLQKGVNTGVVQMMSRMSTPAARSHLSRISCPINRDGKSPQPRMLHPTDYGIFCPSESPEGQSCGLIKNLALISHVSSGFDSTSIVPMLRSMGMHVLPEDEADDRGIHEVLEDDVPDVDTLSYSESRGVPVFVNGNLVGYDPRGDGERLARELRERRRDGRTVFELSVVRQRRGVFVYLDAGRCMRPLYVIENLRKLPELMARFQNRPTRELWGELLLAGVIEYLDKQEEEAQACSAVEPTDVLKKRPGYYTHVEIDPTALFGLTVSTIPFACRNQAPRNIYQAAMRKQAMEMPMLSYRSRLNDTHTYVLDTPQRALVDTRAARLPSVAAMPPGMEAIVAILCYNGFNQEDSVLMKRSALERGLFRITYYRCIRDEITSRGTEEEAFERPDDDAIGMRGCANYDKLEDDGVVGVGTWVEAGDVIIGKTVMTQEYGESGEQVLKKRDRSTVLKKNEKGWVDRVMYSTNKEGKPAVTVRLRMTRHPEIGDKVGGAVLRAASPPPLSFPPLPLPSRRSSPRGTGKKARSA